MATTKKQKTDAKKEIAAPKKKATVKTTKKPVAKKSTRKKAVVKSASKKTPVQQLHYSIYDMKKALHSVMKPCKECSHFPVGATELVSLLLVLVFSLSAVLMTSVYALHMQSIEIQSLEQQINQ
ncbi:hypothetical protein KJ766_00020 [Patescibacteria group bacterium]|nr:hypothetical protein [Patescibacteria group bacterium]